MKYQCPCPKHELLESKHRHDWQQCSCGDVYVDGGNDYSRLGFKDKPPTAIIDFEAEKKKMIRKQSIEEAKRITKHLRDDQ